MRSINCANSRNKFLKICIYSTISFVLISIVLACLCSISPNRAKAETIEELKAQVKQAEIAYDTALSEQYTQEARYNECQETINYAEQRVPDLQSQIEGRVKEIYVNRSQVSIIELLLGSTSLTDFITNLEYINKINQKDAALVSECTELKRNARQAQEDIWSSIEAAKESAAEAAAILENAQWAIQALEAQNIPVNPEGGGGNVPDPGGEGDDPDPDPGGGGDLPIPYGEDIVSRALACLGHPYGWGCAGSYAFDCSGLVSYAYSGQFAHLYSTYTIRDAAGNGLNGWYRTDNPTNGTCCCSVEHCGIYYNGEMIHAPDIGEVVKIGPIQGNMLFYNR